MLTRFPPANVPEGWVSTPLREICSELNERAGAEKLRALSVTKHRGIVPADTYFSKDVRSRDVSKYKVLRSGQFAYATIHLNEGSIGRLEGIECGLVSPMYTTFEIDEAQVDPQYLLAELKSPPALLNYEGLTQGTVNRRGSVPFEAFASLVLVHPTLRAQRQISTMLQAADMAIKANEDWAIAVRQLRGAVLDEEFSKGRSTWQWLRGDEVFDLGGGHGPKDVRFHEHGEALFLKVDDLNHPDNQETITVAALRFQPADNPSVKLYREGSIVFPKRGAAILKNRARVLTRSATVDPNLMVLTTKNGIDPHYMRTLLEWIGLASLADNSGIPQINNKHLYPLEILLPPPAEQARMAEIRRAFDCALSIAAKYSGCLQELRRTMTESLLTGRVRPPLPSMASMGTP